MKTRYFRIIALTVLLLTASGCAHVAPDIRVEKVPEPPVIIKPARPDLVGQPPAEQVRGLYDYLLRLESTLEEALNALNVYRATSEKPKGSK